MKDQITVTIMGKEVQVEKGLTLLEISKNYGERFVTPIVIALVDFDLKELGYVVEEPCNITFLDITDKDGYKTYQRSLSFLMVKAIQDVLGQGEYVETIIHYAINTGFYCDIKGVGKLNESHLQAIYQRMQAIIALDLPFEKSPVKVDVAKGIFEKQNMFDKMELFKYRRSSNVNLYRLEHYYDYFYGYLVPSTGCLAHFSLHLYDEGLILQFVTRAEPKTVAPFNPDKKLFNTLKINAKWGEIMEVENVGDLNKVIASGKMNDLILVSEALMEKRIADIADKIVEHQHKKRFVFIAGPSSSGKTTFANRLAIQLRSHGAKPHTISLDNYFLSREKTPRDANGQYDFECIEALDLEAFNVDMNNLCAGKTVDMPVFNFVSGEREYKGKYLTLEENDILVIEGIHGLNNKLSYSLPEESVFRIYISALTQLNIDNHNRIPTTDARLIRRMVRDNQYRGATASKTIGMWESVRRGEENFIFPFQEQADAMFNSVLIYELAVLKQYAEPLLFHVPRESAQYSEARRLIKFLDYFLGVSSEKIPYNSLLREFIGGSCF